MKKIKFKKSAILIILFIILLLVMLIVYNKQLIGNVFKTKIKNEEQKLFSYVVYDNQDEQKIKVLITVNSENGIEYIECPNGNKINTNGKNNFAIDYIVEKEKNYSFAIKENNKEQIIQELAINNDSIEETTLKINKITDISGYKVIDVDKKINLEDYSEVYYKISENGTWVQGSKFSLIDYDLSTNELINEDGTVTVYAKVSNSKTNNEIVINKNLNVNTTEETKSIQAESLLGAIGDNELKNGKYEVTVSDEIYNVKVYNIDSSIIMSVDTTFGTEEDVATSTEEYAKNMIIVKVNGDLTIDENVKLTSYANKDGYGGPKGMMIYCTGTLTNNGTISMTARGAYAEGQNVYMWKNEDGSYEYVPAVGAEGGKKISTSANGKKGSNGTNRQTGGGGSGSCYSEGGTSGAGAKGTSYSGGAGGGAITTIAKGNAGAGNENRWSWRRRK